MSEINIFQIILKEKMPLQVGHNQLHLEIHNHSAQAYSHLVITLKPAPNLTLRPTKPELPFLPANTSRIVFLSLQAHQAGRHKIEVRRVSAPGLTRRFTPVTLWVEVAPIDSPPTETLVEDIFDQPPMFSIERQERIRHLWEELIQYRKNRDKLLMKAAKYGSSLEVPLSLDNQREEIEDKIEDIEAELDELIADE
jgi:hypothetical protein